MIRAQASIINDLATIKWFMCPSPCTNAQGLSLNQLAYLGRRDLVEELIIKLLQVREGLGKVQGQSATSGWPPSR